jgi:inosine-uridine nucleoside N-ribohydrolase
MFLDPLTAKAVLESKLNITLIPVATQRKFASFEGILGAVEQCTERTPEATFVHGLLLMLQELQRKERLSPYGNTSLHLTQS